MNDLEMLRLFNPQVKGASAEVLDTARTKLQAAIDVELDATTNPTPHRREGTNAQHRWRLLRPVSFATIAATILGILVIQLAATNGQRSGASAEARLLLADAAQTSAVPTPGNGQYLYATSTGLSRITQTCGSASLVNIKATFTAQSWISAAGAPVRTTLLYARPQFATASDEAAAAACPAMLDDVGLQLHAATVIDQLNPTRAGSGPFQTPDTAYLASLPRDPAKLVTALANHATGPEAAQRTLTNAIDLLGNTVRLPADLRTAVLAAIGRISGVTVTSRGVLLDGRTGDGIGLTSTTRVRTELVIDPATGFVLGERDVLAADDGNLTTGSVVSYLCTRYGLATSPTDVPINLR